MVAPCFCHGGTTFSWMTISFFWAASNNMVPRWWQKMLNGICDYSSNHLAPNSPRCSTILRPPKNPLRNIYSLIVVVLRTQHNWELCNLQFLHQKDGGNMLENIVDFSQKSIMFSIIFPPSSISKPHGANMAQSCSVAVFFWRSCSVTSAMVAPRFHHGGTTFLPWYHHILRD